LTTFDAIILGIVQGLTEFLPVSSSGHLQLVQHFLGLSKLDDYILFDLACHLGTLLAILIVFSNNIRSLFSKADFTLRLVIIGTLPLFPLVLILKPIKAFYADPSYLGFFFLITAAILFIGCKAKAMKPATERHWKEALTIGLWQAAAILPGVSRSGSTITGARLLGWSPQEAVAFSFLLAIPAILGGTTLELYKLWSAPEAVPSLPLASYLAGFTVSFLVGMGSLKLLMRFAANDKLSYFAWYCLFLGVAVIGYMFVS
jgi:undecaprenyl-diphosphatase